MRKISIKQKMLFFVLTFIVVNLFLFIALSLYNQVLQEILILYLLVFHVFWFTAVAYYLGFDVLGPPADWFTAPNALGWLFAVIGCSITFVVYYFISSKIAAFWIKRRLKSE